MGGIRQSAKSFRGNIYFRVRVMLCSSLSVNIIFAVFSLASAAFRESFWEGALAVYHLILCGLYAYLVRCLPDGETRDEHMRELQAEQKAGFALTALDFALGGIMVQVIRLGRSYIYPRYLIYGMALFAFCSLGFSILNVIKYRKLRSPVLSAAGAVNLTVSLMTLFGLETALLTAFGGGDTDFRRNITSVTAIFICIVVFVISGLMGMRTGKQIRKLRKTESETEKTDSRL